MGETRAPMRPHHNEIDLARLRGVNDLLKGDTMHYDNLSRKPSGGDTGEVALHITRDRGFEFVNKRC